MAALLTQGEILELANSRMAPYAFLSRLLKSEVDISTLKTIASLCDMSSDNSHDNMPSDPPANSVEPDGSQRMALFVQDRLADGHSFEDIVRELTTDFSQLFLLGASSIHPYESVYTSDRHLLMQEAYRDALHAYAQSGFEQTPESKEIADHIAIELEFMSKTAAQVADAFAQNNTELARDILSRQQRFHRIHLHWVTQFSRDMNTYACTDFYRGVAQLLQSVVDADTAFMQSMQDYLTA